MEANKSTLFRVNANIYLARLTTISFPDSEPDFRRESTGQTSDTHLYEIIHIKILRLQQILLSREIFVRASLVTTSNISYIILTVFLPQTITSRSLYVYLGSLFSGTLTVRKYLV